MFEGARDHCAADITASPKITNILERRSPSPVIKDGAYGDITELELGPLGSGWHHRPSHFSQLHHNGER